MDTINHINQLPKGRVVEGPIYKDNLYIVLYDNYDQERFELLQSSDMGETWKRFVLTSISDWVHYQNNPKAIIILRGEVEPFWGKLY